MWIVTPRLIRIFSAWAGLSWATFVQAQAPSLMAPRDFAGAELPSLRVAATKVSESRNSTGNGELNLTVSIFGESLPANAYVRQIEVTKAVDNLGQPLAPANLLSSGEGLMSVQQVLISARAATGMLQGTLSLTGASRKAESIQYVEGTIEFYLPTELNGAMIRIPNVMDRSGKIQDPRLQRSGIEFFFFGDKASFDQARPQLPARLSNPPEFPLGAGFYVRDPSSQFAGYQLLDAGDQQLQAGVNWGSSSTDTSMTGVVNGNIRLRRPLSKESQLVIYISVPEAVRTVPFRIENIALP